MSSANPPGDPPVHSKGNDLGRFGRDDDPQSIFYLNLLKTEAAMQQAYDASIKDILVTLYSWATKIEDTVREKLGNGDTKGYRTIQSCWDRAAFRAKLLDFLARDTPWFMELHDDVQIPTKKELTGDYYGDKLLFKDAVHELLRDRLSEIPTEKLRLVEKYIAEIMVLGQENLAKVQRFSLAYPTLVGEGLAAQSALRVIMIAFEVKVDKDGGRTLEIGRTSYQAALNKKVFDGQKFDQKLLDVGKKLVLDATFDVIV